MGDLYKHSDKTSGRYDEYVHVFQVIDTSDMKGIKKCWKQKFWQIFPVTCASLLAVPFGIMLGWPSHTYPYLTQSTSVIPISMSQSAMVAGFLMLGVTLATPFASKYHLGPKYGIWIGMILVTIGWILMWYSRNIFWLLGSRLIVGLGSGYGLGQVRNYIRDMCEPKLAVTLTKQLNFYGFLGLSIAYIFGTFLDFRKFSVITVIISVFILFITLLLPCTPKDFMKRNQVDKAIRLLDYLRGKKDHTSEITKIQNELSLVNDDSLVKLLKNKILRKEFMKFFLLIFFQQFSGAPATIVYCELIFIRSGCPYAEYCAVLYSIMYFISNVYGTFYSPCLNKKYMLVFSCITSSIMLIAQILVLYFEVNDKFWSYTSLVIMLLFIAFYCIGIGNIPHSFISVWFPVQYKQVLTNVFIMAFSMLALIATKVFQVFITSFPLYVGFCVFLIVDLSCLIFVIFFVKNTSESNENYLQSNTIYFWNANKSQEVKNMSSR